ncbi:hypothetical protein KAT73_02475, partial [candidate division WOR-3 bacterium]|nr:hypothetical protein [candidate division WOR-3 bacterium]
LHQQADALQKQYFTIPHLPNLFDICHLDFHWKLETWPALMHTLAPIRCGVNADIQDKDFIYKGLTGKIIRKCINDRVKK